MFLDEYRKSLKMPEAEEALDLLFYRPVAFGFVKLIYRLPITPNQITIASLGSGLIAAYEFSLGVQGALFFAALLYAVANVLDCADGQLARLQNSGTPFGRLIDGIADYISSIAIFIGIAIGLQVSGQPAWILVFGAMLSSALHAMFFDHYQGEFISTVRNEKNFLDRETEKFTLQTGKGQTEEGYFKRVVLAIYLRYLKIQKRSSTKAYSGSVDPQLYRRLNSTAIRLWSLLGPTTNRTLLILCALFSRVDVYLWIICLAGNGWFIILYFLQRRIHARLSTFSEVIS